jgi:hypothetical protein
MQQEQSQSKTKTRVARRAKKSGNFADASGLVSLRTFIDSGKQRRSRVLMNLFRKATKEDRSRKRLREK